jgi:hypothetical protein
LTGVFYAGAFLIPHVVVMVPAAILHGAGPGTVSPQRLPNSLEAHLPGPERYKSLPFCLILKV